MLKCEADELGYWQGCKVTAATDGAGPQVIVQGEGRHLLSRPLKDHKAAVKMGKRVVREGPDFYKEWADLAGGSIAEQLFAVFGGGLQPTEPPDKPFPDPLA